MYEVAHPPRARGGFRCSAGARWQKNAFRCSFGRRIGSETGFGAVRTPSAPASAEFACVFRCKNNEKTDLGPPFWRPDGQNGESGPQSAAITAPKPVWLPGGSGLLHRNPSGCQAGRDCCTETHLPAKWDAIAAPELARLPSNPPRLRRASPGCRPPASLKRPETHLEVWPSASLPQKPPWDQTLPCLGLSRAGRDETEH